MTQIQFTMPASGPVEITVYNIAGQKVKTLTNSVYGEGVHAVSWDGRDTMGNKVSSGVYFYKLHSGTETHVRKMTLMR
jgi:flagellar hook assembly protein FlgD